MLLVVVQMTRAEDPKTLAIGQKAPDFQLTGIDGKTYTLESFREAKVLTIVFTANHCPTAQAYEERIKKLSSDYRTEQMKLVAISSNDPGALCLEEIGYSDLGDSFEEIKIRAKERDFNFPYLYDGDTQEVAHAYGAKATPHVFIFDENRILRYTGRIDDTEDPYRVPSQTDARNAIDALLSGKDVPVETTRAFGCSMKWKSKIAWRKKLDEEWNNRQVDLQEIDADGIKEVVENRGESLKLINVWATWCGPCIIEFPELVDIQRMYEGRGLKVVSVSTDNLSQKEKVMKFLEDKEAAFTNYLYGSEMKDEMFDIIDPQWQGNLPYTMLVAPGGRVVYRHDGIIDPLEVRKAIIGQVGRYYADDIKEARDIFDRDNLIAWCIVPFDAMERSPEERATMLEELGISMLAYDYRERHVPSFEQEIQSLKKHNISLRAVWLYVDPQTEELMNPMCRSILNTLKETGTRTELWVSFPDHFFEGLTDSEKHEKAVDAVKEILAEAEEIGCTVALYNHGGWFGETENQIGIIKAIGSEKLRMVYNFHHGHHQLDRFEELFEMMLPYLSAVNINGMKAEGPMIITLGEGDRELEMLRFIKESGYSGPIGILGHTEGEDIRPVLERNLRGLEKLKSSL